MADSKPLAEEVPEPVVVMEDKGSSNFVAIIGFVVTVIIVVALVQLFKFKDSPYKPLRQNKDKREDDEANISLQDIKQEQKKRPTSFSTIGYAMSKQRKE
jgi:hypothetical protein